MIHELQITARPQAGGLERILRTLRVRGYQVLYLEADLDVARERMHLVVRASGERTLDLLERQLMRLVEVEKVLAAHRGAGDAAARACQS